MVSNPAPSAVSTPKKGPERRRFPRAPADWPLTVRLKDGAHIARIRDVSRAGVSFFLERPIPVMTLLQISLDLPFENGSRSIEGNGAVVRCERISEALEHYEVAVFLHDMDGVSRDALDSYVRGEALA